MWSLYCAFLPLLPLVSSSPLVVLQTTSDLSQFVADSGAQILKSSLLGHSQATICARFFIYRFRNEKYTTVFAFGSVPELFSRWTSFGTIEGLMNAGPLNRKPLPIWNPGVWNNVCLMLDTDNQVMKTVINGHTVLIDNTYTISHHKNNHSLTIMAFPTSNGVEDSMFGRMTDVNLWSRSLAEEEAQAWTKCHSLESL